jgi:hypothetical protein
MKDTNLCGHSIPNLGPLLVPPDIIRLGSRVHDYQVYAADDDEYAISATI